VGQRGEDAQVREREVTRRGRPIVENGRPRCRGPGTAGFRAGPSSDRGGDGGTGEEPLQPQAGSLSIVSQQAGGFWRGRERTRVAGLRPGTVNQLPKQGPAARRESSAGFSATAAASGRAREQTRARAPRPWHSQRGVPCGPGNVSWLSRPKQAKLIPGARRFAMGRGRQRASLEGSTAPHRQSRSGTITRASHRDIAELKL